MPTLIVTDVATGQQLDRVTLADDGLHFHTGSAEPLFAAMLAAGTAAREAFDLRTAWSNGYVRTTPVIDVEALPAIPGLREEVTGALTASFNPGQPRDGDGQWTGGTPGPRAMRVSDGSMDVTVGADGGGAVRLDIGAFRGDDGDESAAGSPVTLDAPAAAELARLLADSDAAGRGRRDEIVGNWERIDELEARFREAHKAARRRRDPDTLEYTPEDRAAIEAIQAELDPLHEWEATLEVDDVISETVLPGTGENDLAYRLQGVDDEKGGWEIALAARPKNADSDWQFPHPEDGDAVYMSPAEAAALRRTVAPTVRTSMAYDPRQRRDIGEAGLFVAKTDKGRFHVARGESDREVLIDLDNAKAASLADFVLLFTENEPGFDVADPLSGANVRSAGNGGVRVDWPQGSSTELTEDGALALQEALRALGPGFTDDDD
jgi:hypothetical protein